MKPLRFVNTGLQAGVALCTKESRLNGLKPHAAA